MNWSPLLEASPAIQAHVATVAIAVVLTGPMLVLRKGTALHVMMGRTWVAAMMLTALISFGIQLGGGFSFIHLFSVITLISAPYAIWAIRRGNIRGHAISMLSLIFGALGIAGAFTLSEGRILHSVIWGS